EEAGDGVETAGRTDAVHSSNVHSPDFRSVHWAGKPYEFTPLQARCVQVLWESWERGVPPVGEQTILERADSESRRLRDVFDKGEHPAWDTMIVPGGTKGSFRLADPEIADPQKIHP